MGNTATTAPRLERLINSTPCQNVPVTIRNKAAYPSQAESGSKQNLANAGVADAAIKSRDTSPFVRNTITNATEVHQDTLFASRQNLKGKTQSSDFVRGRKKRQELRLFLGGLPDNITEAELKKTFESFGKVSDVQIVLDKETNKSKRYGFLEYEDENSFEKCLQLHFTVINGKRVEIKRAWPRGHSREGKDHSKERSRKNKWEKSHAAVKDSEKLANSSVASSSETELNSKDNQLSFQKILEDYLKAKFALKNLINSGTLIDEILNLEESRESRLEKWLAGLGESANEGSSVGIQVNFPSASSDSEELACTICQWAPLNNSFEDLLAHCKTPIHRQKLMERFQVNKSQNQTSNRDNQIDKENGDQQSTRKGRSRYKLQEASVGIQDSQKKHMKFAFRENMRSIEVKSEKWVKCKMCNVTIPPSDDIQTLTKNLAHHLQSKRHLARIREKSVQKQETKTEIKTDTKAEKENA